jgi:hypothetical protein
LIKENNPKLIRAVNPTPKTPAIATEILSLLIPIIE